LPILSDVAVVFDIDYEHLGMMGIMHKMSISAFYAKSIAFKKQSLNTISFTPAE